MSEIIAKVNNVNIYKSHLNRVLESYIDFIGDRTADKFKIDEYKTLILEELIDRALLVDYAILNDISIDDSDMSELDESFNYNYDHILEPYDPEADDEETQDAKSELIKSKVMDIIVKENEDFEYDEDHLIDFYNENLDMFKTDQAVDVRHVFVSTEDIDNDEDFEKAKSKINYAREELLSGSDFSDVARTYSECPSREFGGDLGIVNKKQISYEFDQVAFNIEENKISDVFMTDYGMHFIEVKKRYDNYHVPFSRVKNALIDMIKEERAVYLLDSFLDELREKANIEIYSI